MNVHSGSSYILREEVSREVILFYTFVTVLAMITSETLKKFPRLSFLKSSMVATSYGLVFGLILFLTSPPSKPIEENPVADNTDHLKATTSANATREQKPSIINIVNLRSVAMFSPEIFFNLFLPIIVFQAGLTLKNRFLFRNIGAVTTYAFIGTLLSFLIVSGFLILVSGMLGKQSKHLNTLDLLFFGAIISATDPVSILALFEELNVDPFLHYLVLGESILNDAVVVTLTHSILSIGSSISTLDWSIFVKLCKILLHLMMVLFVSQFFGFLSASIMSLYTKFSAIDQNPVKEVAIFTLVSYSSYTVSEMLGFSGVVAMMFCGIFQSHYTFHNMSEEAKYIVKLAFNFSSLCVETFCFVYIGVSATMYRDHVWDIRFILFSFVGIVVSRAVNIYGLSLLLNVFRRKKIPCTDQHVLMFSGLRGAVAFALALRGSPNLSHGRRLILSTTTVIVIATVYGCGALAGCVIKCLKIGAVVEDVSEGEETVDEADRYCACVQMVNKKLLLPLLTNSTPSLKQTLSTSCKCLAKIFTSRKQSSEESSISEVELSFTKT